MTINECNDETTKTMATGGGGGGGNIIAKATPGNMTRQFTIAMWDGPRICYDTDAMQRYAN